MSSIYRKGRDGYFYYQTYVRNSDTGKKDKRIFHSLKTKNEEEALIKQQILDDKYHKINSKQTFTTLKWIKNNYQLIMLVVCVSVFTLFIEKFIDQAKALNK